MLLIYTIIHRNNTLNSDFIITKAKIIEVEIDAPKGITTTKNIAKYTYSYKEEKFLKTVEIYNRPVKSGFCYKIKVAKKNPGISKINLDERISCDD